MEVSTRRSKLVHNGQHDLGLSVHEILLFEVENLSSRVKLYIIIKRILWCFLSSRYVISDMSLVEWKPED